MEANNKENKTTKLFSPAETEWYWLTGWSFLEIDNTNLCIGSTFEESIVSRRIKTWQRELDN